MKFCLDERPDIKEQLGIGNYVLAEHGGDAPYTAPMPIHATEPNLEEKHIRDDFE